MKRQAKQTQETQAPTMKSLNISEIDLTQLTVTELAELKQRIAAILNNYAVLANKHDVVLEYDVRLRTQQGVICENEGSVKLGSILHPRLIADAPRRFETAFLENVYTPVHAEAFELFDNPVYTGGNSLEPLSNNVKALESHPGIIIPPLHIT